jgi:hypothetical protein
MLTALLGVGANLVAQNGKRATKLFEGKLAHVPGHTLTAEVVEFPRATNPKFTITPAASLPMY